jgi:hypothetical protein
MSNIEKKQIINEIVSLHNEISGLLKMSLKKAIRIGELLSEQKASLKHGEFIPWIKANLPFTERTAQNYMRLYQHRDQLKNETVSYLTEGYKLLQEPPEPSKQKSLLEQLQDLAVKRLYAMADLGSLMDDMNKLLTPAGEHVIMGDTGSTVFKIEGKEFTVFKLGKKVGEHKERRWGYSGDIWWYLDKHVGIGRVNRIFQLPDLRLTDEELHRCIEAPDIDRAIEMRQQIIDERIDSAARNPSFVEAAHKLSNSLMDAYVRLCEKYALLMGKPEKV